MKYIEPTILVMLGAWVSIMGITLSIIGSYLLGTSLSDARNPTEAGVYRKLALGFYMKVDRPVSMDEMKKGVEYKFVPEFNRASGKIVPDEDGILRKVTVDEN